MIKSVSLIIEGEAVVYTKLVESLLEIISTLYEGPLDRKRELGLTC